MSKLLEEAQKRETQFESVQTELQLQLKLLEAQVKKAQLEKAEIKCEMTQERMELAQELNLERDRSINLESCLLYTSPSPRDRTRSRMPSSA